MLNPKRSSLKHSPAIASFIIFFVIILTSCDLNSPLYADTEEIQPTENYKIGQFEIETPTSIKIKPLPTTTRNIVEPTQSLAESNITANYSCPDTDKIRLSIGATGRIGVNDINLRKKPVVPDDYDSNVILILRSERDTVVVLDGPVCSHDGTWWYVSTEYNKNGWVREYRPSDGYLVVLVSNP